VTATCLVRRSPGRCLLIAVILAAAAVLFTVYWLPTARERYGHLQMVQSGPSRPQYDFWQYYAAGNNWRLGADPYAAVPRGLGTISFPRTTTTSGYIYPPTALPVFGELSRLTYDQARAVWLGACLAALLCPLAIGVVLARGRRWETAALGALLFVSSDPVLFHIRQGQIDMIVAGLSVTAFLLYGRWRSWPTAVLFALAVALKLTPAVVALSLVVYHRDWRLLAKTVIAGLVVFAVSLLVVSPGLYWEYVTTVLPAASEGNPFFHNQSLLRGWSHLDVWAKYASMGGYALVVAAAAVAGRGRSRLTEQSGRPGVTGDATQLLVLAVMGVLLFSPLSWRMAFVWAVVPSALALAATRWDGTRWQWALVAAGAVLMCLAPWDHPVLDSLETIGAVLAATGALAALLQRAARYGPGTPYAELPDGRAGPATRTSGFSAG
jgi:hypothetical protein